MLMAETGKARRAWGIGLMYKNSGPMPHDKARKDAPCRDGVTPQQAARMGRMAPPKRGNLHRARKRDEGYVYTIRW